MRRGPILHALIALVVLVATSEARSDPALPLSHLSVDVTLHVPEHSLAATAIVTLGSAPPGGEPWRFLLHRDLKIESVMDPDGKPVPWVEAAGWNPRHFWRRPPYAELDAFTVAREVAMGPPAAGWRTSPRIVVSYRGIVADSLHVHDTTYGRSSETTSGRIVDRGAYLHGGTFWVPWSGDEPFAFDLTVNGPATWRVISQGDERADSITDGGRRLSKWSAGPSEEVFLIAGPYEVRETEYVGAEDSIRILSYCYSSTGRDITDRYLDATGPAIARFEKLFGPYPYGKFALVENYWQTGYGMPSFTFLGDRVIRLPFIVGTSYPHEILHNWWGNGVFVERATGNWCEGLTTYCADYLAKEKAGDAPARDYRRAMLQRYRDFAVEGGKDFALVRFRERDSAATQAVGYGKTAMVFHMLRREVGEDAFFGALRSLYVTHRFRRAGWRDLRVAFERETGRPLAKWFTAWVERPGAPALSLADVRVDADGAKFTVRGVLVQKGTDYAFRVPVLIEGDAGESVWHEVVVEEERSAFELPVAFSPAVVRADPAFDVFRLLHADEVAPVLSGVLGAARARIVIGLETAGEVRDALREIAEEWARDSTVTVVFEEGELPPFDGGTWLFGEGPAADAFVAGDLPSTPVDSGAHVLAGRLGGDPTRPAALFVPESAETAAGVARKIRHYSQWSFLRFEGSRNVDKGTWETGSSPLAVSVAPDSSS